MEVFLQVMVLFVLLIAGYLAARFHVIDRQGFYGLNRFVIYFAMPALIIAKLQTQADTALLIALSKALLVAFLAMLVCAGLTFLIFKKENPARRAVFTNLAMFSNCGFMGYPVVEARFGPDALVYAVMFVTAFNLLAWTVGSGLFTNGRGVSLKAIVTNSSLIAVVIGLACLVFQITIPKPFSSVLDMVGATTTPLSLVVIGAQLVGLPLKILKDKGMLVTLGLRLVIYPLLLLCAVRLLHLPDPMGATLYLCYAMPSAALTAMQAEHFDCEAPLASAGVAISTALSMATIPLMLLLIA